LLVSEEFLKRFASVGGKVQIFQSALILKPEVIELSEGVRIDDYARIEGGLGLKIGQYVHISSFASILGGGKATVGDFSGIGQGAKLVTGLGHPFEANFPVLLPDDDVYHRMRGEITVGAFSFVAVNAVVLPGVEIGEGAIVAAGSVVTKNVPPWKVVAGIPARVVKERKNFLLKDSK
jgi:acetyltransferase-like isoleucine patch superfamily enzyme